MIDHLGISCADLTAATRFYDGVLAVLGASRLMDVGSAVGYGTDHATFWVSGVPGASSRETHVAFSAPDRATVDAFYTAALGLGAESLHAPRLWPEYHPGYYGAFVRDPDGNNVEAVFHGG
ncbi:putative glyoxalase/bleomycin resistance protein [Tsukamurella pulmonis]|uniref:Catechol 2,3-dioxygenase n=1 Tax=Tsukamurella pulmonis TaxID=47312 RepID=A0A1H1HRU3_9ACTN|nr:VOC family protein [Tsukamurella pulmonis]KXO94437.1 glyoxalase [Tsukamurella pulmonis]KXP12252.1 glyoxalase [Tsukamurella pulmonis]RDH10425.1 VOC family protein [Tsukamurella pulmonis]SDR28144.1 Catechol 2,3-dioxygenase [Tsukamurella pulmonis]SUP13461.1 Predicted lactoylglutathione lyase [Tsukamurella pulmonis]